MYSIELIQKRKNRADAIKSARKKKGISLNKLSELTGISRGSLTKIENAVSSWRIDTEIIIMEALGISQIEIGGSIEISQESGKITGLKITGVILNNPSAQA